MRLEADVTQQHDLVVAGDLFEGTLQILARVVEISGKPFFVGANEAARCAAKPFALGVVAGPADQSLDRGFRLPARRPLLLPAPHRAAQLLGCHRCPLLPVSKLETFLRMGELSIARGGCQPAATGKTDAVILPVSDCDTNASVCVTSALFPARAPA